MDHARVCDLRICRLKCRKADIEFDSNTAHGVTTSYSVVHSYFPFSITYPVMPRDHWQSSGFPLMTFTKYHRTAWRHGHTFVAIKLPILPQQFPQRHHLTAPFMGRMCDNSSIFRFGVRRLFGCHPCDTVTKSSGNAT